MLLTCKCLNVSITINGTGIKPVDLLELGFSKENLHDEFFKNGAGTVELVEISKEVPSLVYIRNVDDWLIHRCLLCGCLTHAIHRERRSADVLVTYTLLSDPEQMAALKASDAYSEVFRVVTNRHDKLHTTDDSVKLTGAGHMGALALQQALIEALKVRTAQVEERVRTFTEQQFAELEEFRSTAHEDHQTLMGVLQRHAELLAEEAHVRPVSERVTKATVVEKSIGLPPVPHPLQPVRTTLVKSAPATRIRRPFSATTAGSPRQQSRMGHRSRGSFGPQVSLDSEGLFDLEGMEEGTAKEEQSHSGDETEEDTDESGSHDEGIHIPRSRGSGTCSNLQLAKSLPVNVPAFHLAFALDHNGDPFAPERQQLATDFQRDQDRMDIAASIKALAQSVRGGASVFGDLPRPPRFSTQL